MRRILFFGLILLATSARGSVKFVSPLDGTQAIGPMLLEISTDAAAVDRVDFFVDGVLAGATRTPPYRISFDFGTALSQRTISAKVWTGGFTSFETAEVHTFSPTANETLNVDLVEVPMRIRSARTLEPSDLRLRENGVRQTIRELKAERPPAHFAFVIDRSMSMDGGKLGAALTAVRSALSQLRSGDSASIVLFNHNVAKAAPIKSGEDLVGTFDDIVPSGGTSLRDALASVISDDRTYAIAITDGGDRNSALPEEQALRSISGTKTVVSAIVLGSSHTDFLDRAARNTGGTVAAATKESLASALGALMADINSRYLLVYQSEGTRRGWRTIEIKPRRRGVSITAARKGYFAQP